MTIPLPAALKRRIQPLPQWPPIALRAPQEGVQVRLITGRGEIDVTRAAVVASLRPLTIGVGLDAGLLSAIKGTTGPALQFIDLESGRMVGSLRRGPPSDCSKFNVASIAASAGRGVP
jgi:hypothetical protein